MTIDYDKAKRDIDLERYIIDTGLYRRKNSAKPNPLIEVGNPSNEIHIYKGKRTGHWMYKDHKNNDAGSIIDFIKKKQGKNEHELLSILSDELGILKSNPNYKAQKATPNVAQQENKPFSYPFPLNELTSSPLLTVERKISPETYNNDIFKNTSYNTKIKVSNGNTYHCIAFPLYHIKDILSPEKKIIGLERKNGYIKGKAENSNFSNGIWFSNANTDKPFDVIIVESTIDAYSHFEYKNITSEKKDLVNNPLYISLQGTLYNDKLKDLASFYQKYKSDINSFHLANDNDIAGHLFSLNIASELGFSDYSFSISKDGKVSTIEFKEGDKDKFLKTLDHISEKLDSISISKNSNNRFSASIEDNNKFTFNTNIMSYKLLSHLFINSNNLDVPHLKDAKGKSNLKLKDWNDLLKYHKDGIRETKKIKHKF